MRINMVSLIQAGTPIGILSLMLWGLFLRACHDKGSRFLATLYCSTLFCIGVGVLILISTI